MERTKLIAIVGVIILVVVVAAALLLYKPGAPTTTTPAATTPAAAPAPKKVTITIEYGEPWKDLVKPAIKKFVEAAKAKGYDVKVEEKMIPYGQDIMSVIISDLSAGTAGDVIIVDSFMIPSLASAGYLLPLDDLVAKWPDWDQFYPAMKKIVMYKGKVYGVMIDTDVRMIWYRKDLFKKAGLPEDWQPKTWDDILEAAKKLKEAGVEYPLYIPAGTKWGEATTMQGFYMLLLGADKPPYNRLYDYDKGKWVCKSTALWRAFKFYIDVYQKLKVGPVEYNFAPDVWATHRKVFSEGKVAMDIGGSWEWGEGWGPDGIAPLKACKERCGEDKACYEKCEKEYIGFAKMPGYKGGALGEPKYVTISGGWAVALNAKLAKDKTKLELAWELVKTIASKELDAKFCAKYGKISPRKDAVEVPEYGQNWYLKAISEYLSFTDFRDAMPDYPKVSKIIQEITEKIIKGIITDPDTALDEYCKALKREVGEDKVIEYPVKKE